MLGVSTPAWCLAPGRRRPPASSSRVIRRCAGRPLQARAGPRDQVRRLPHAGAPARRAACHLHAAGARVDAALPEDRRCPRGALTRTSSKPAARPGTPSSRKPVASAPCARSTGHNRSVLSGVGIRPTMPKYRKRPAEGKPLAGVRGSAGSWRSELLDSALQKRRGGKASVIGRLIVGLGMTPAP
jgi:hypothetical protein